MMEVGVRGRDAWDAGDGGHAYDCRCRPGTFIATC